MTLLVESYQIKLNILPSKTVTKIRAGIKRGTGMVEWLNETEWRNGTDWRDGMAERNGIAERNSGTEWNGMAKRNGDKTRNGMRNGMGIKRGMGLKLPKNSINFCVILYDISITMHKQTAITSHLLARSIFKILC